MSLDMFLGDSNANAILPHVVYVGSTTGGFVTHTISAVNDDILRVLVGEQDVAEQLGAFKLGLANNNTGGLQSTGILDSYGYETNVMGKSLQFKTGISGVAAQKLDTLVGLSGGAVENEDVIDIGDVDGNDVFDDDAADDDDDDDDDGAGDNATGRVPEPTVVRGGFIVDQNGSVIGESKSSIRRPASAIKRPSRAPPARPTSSPAASPYTQRGKGRMTLRELMESPPPSSSTRPPAPAAPNTRARVSQKYTKSDTSWRDQFSVERKQQERAARQGRGVKKEK